MPIWRACFCAMPWQLALELLRVLELHLPQALDVEVVQGDAVLERQHQQRVHHGLGQVVRVPRLVGPDPEDLVPDVLVLADDVRVRVVQVVVGVLPLVGGADVVPLPRRRVDLRVVHPVELAVHDVVADLHVLEDLGHGQRQRSGPPQLAAVAAEEHRPARHVEAALDRDESADVGGVLVAALLLEVGADLVELAAEGLHVRLTEVGELLDVGDGHGLFLSGGDVGPGRAGNEVRCRARRRLRRRRCMSGS